MFFPYFVPMPVVIRPPDHLIMRPSTTVATRDAVLAPSLVETSLSISF